jgi:ADP-ribose pyrophosphatase YjhB (NUDIX family)
MEQEHILIGVGAIVKDSEGRVLLVKHRPARGGIWQGKWICPGGMLEWGESIEEGIKREVAEETHLEIRLIAPVVLHERIVKSEGKTQFHIVYIAYVADVSGGELKPDSDVGEAIWLLGEDIINLGEELDEDTRVLLERTGVI